MSSFTEYESILLCLSKIPLDKHLAQKLGCHLKACVQHWRTGSNSDTLLLIQLPAIAKPEKQKLMAQLLDFLILLWNIPVRFQTPGSCLAQPWLQQEFENEAHKRNSVSLCLSASGEKIKINKILKITLGATEDFVKH